MLGIIFKVMDLIEFLEPDNIRFHVITRIAKYVDPFLDKNPMVLEKLKERSFRRMNRSAEREMKRNGYEKENQY